MSDSGDVRARQRAGGVSADTTLTPEDEELRAWLVDAGEAAPGATAADSRARSRASRLTTDPAVLGRRRRRQRRSRGRRQLCLALGAVRAPRGRPGILLAVRSTTATEQISKGTLRVSASSFSCEYPSCLDMFRHVHPVGRRPDYGPSTARYAHIE